jgi:AcrR family transcriptional regulator
MNGRQNPIQKARAAPARREVPVKRVDRRQRRSEEIRGRLYHAALRLFAERGFQETTVEAITEAADVGKGTFFNYFPTKEHVLAAYGSERLAEVERALNRARSTTGPVLEVLRDLAVDAAGQAKERPALLRAIFAAHASCAPVRAQLKQRLHTGRELLAEIFALAQGRGEVRRDLSAMDLSRRTQGLVLGVTMYGALVAEEPLARKTEEIWEIFCAGLLPGRNGKHSRKRREPRRNAA